MNLPASQAAGSAIPSAFGHHANTCRRSVRELARWCGDRLRSASRTASASPSSTNSGRRCCLCRPWRLQRRPQDRHPLTTAMRRSEQLAHKVRGWLLRFGRDYVELHRITLDCPWPTTTRHLRGRDRSIPRSVSARSLADAGIVPIVGSADTPTLCRGPPRASLLEPVGARKTRS